MTNGSRGLRETVVRALAKVGLVWAVAVLGALFMTMSAQAQHPDGGYAVSSTRAGGHDTSPSASSSDDPHVAGLALALVLLGCGVTVLAVGATRSERAVLDTTVDEPDPASDLPLFLGVGLLA